MPSDPIATEYMPPTTDGVRFAYFENKWAARAAVPNEGQAAATDRAFDRWLASVRAAAREQALREAREVVAAYASNCAVMRVEPSTRGLRNVLDHLDSLLTGKEEG